MIAITNPAESFLTDTVTLCHPQEAVSPAATVWWHLLTSSVTPPKKRKGDALATRPTKRWRTSRWSWKPRSNRGTRLVRYIDFFFLPSLQTNVLPSPHLLLGVDKTWQCDSLADAQGAATSAASASAWRSRWRPTSKRWKSPSTRSVSWSEWPAWSTRWPRNCPTRLPSRRTVAPAGSGTAVAVVRTWQLVTEVEYQ